MKKLFLVVPVFGICFSCSGADPRLTNDDPSAPTLQSVEPRADRKLEETQAEVEHLFTKADAERIVGEGVHLSDSSMTRDKGVVTYKAAYSADRSDIKTGKTGNIYTLFEEYASVSSAKEKYSTIRTANQPNGIEDVDNVGDEAYFHTDNQNFYFIMIRKGTRVFTMKVNKITSNTSLDEFNAVARKIATSL
jgi:hypothetical protein